ncbi:MAG: energy-coupling factor transporter ATPase [bacterium]
MIEIRALHHTYLQGTPLEAEALRGVTLTIPDGDRVAVIGPTGSGKSTLVQTFNGLIRPTGGAVLVGGQDVFAPKTDRRQIRQQVALLFQYAEQQLFEETVTRDVGFGPRNLGLDPEEVTARVEEALGLVGLEPAAFGPRSPFTLSGGEMRRVALAGVLAMRPRVLILDEPTAGLDPQGKADLQRLILDLHARGGITLIVISHTMEEVARVAERVIVLAEGRVVMDGPVREIFARAAELEALHLAVPQPTQVLHRLRARGVPVRTDLLTLEEARAEILRALAPR